MLLGWQVTLHLGILGFIWSLYFSTKKDFLGVLLCTLFFIISFYSFANGGLIFPLITIYYLLIRLEKRLLLFWLILSGIVLLIFFHDYQYITTVNFFNGTINKILVFLNLFALPLNTFGGKFGGIFYLVGSFFGLLLIAILIYSILLLLKNNKNDSDAYFVLIFIAFNLLTFAQISLGRAENGVASSYSIQYVTFSLLYLISNYFFFRFLVLKKISLKVVNNIFCAILLSSVIIGALFGIFYGITFRGERIKDAYVAYTFQHQSNTGLLRISSEPNQIRKILHLLQTKNKSTFYKPDYRYNEIVLTPYLRKPVRSRISDDRTNIDSVSISMLPVTSILSNIAIHTFTLTSSQYDSIQLLVKLDNKIIHTSNFSSKQISVDGCLFQIFDPPLIINTTRDIQIEINKKSKDIGYLLSEKYWGGPTQRDGGDRQKTLSVELNLPVELIDYYKILALPQRISNLKVNLFI